MSKQSDARAAEFLAISHRFKLGALTTESSHPVTANLSEAAAGDIAEGLRLLFEADKDVLETYGRFVESGRAAAIQSEVLRALRAGGRLFFTGCGSTGRLSIQLVSIWREFWQRQGARGLKCVPDPAAWEERAFAVMAGGDYALIKAVEGFEDFTDFGRKQIGDLGVSGKDVVFAITEGGETSFVIGTAWEGVEAGAKVYFVYNNPDTILREQVERSREVIDDPRIEKLNLTTGPMAITGSTRMQATTIQLCVLGTVLEMVLEELLKELDPAASAAFSPASVPSEFFRQLRQMHAALQSAEVLESAAALVALEEKVYRSGRQNNYFADHFGIDILTDTTERSPTYCTPAFRKFDDTAATESWAFLFVPAELTSQAWERIIKRRPRCVEWEEAEVRGLVPEDKAARTLEVVRKIGYAELMRFKVGLDGLRFRPPQPGGSAVAVLGEEESEGLLVTGGFFRKQLEAARQAGARTGVVYCGSGVLPDALRQSIAALDPGCALVQLPVPSSRFLLDGVRRAGLKMLMNAVSTCTMVRLGRVMGNYMIWVVPSNLKLIDRATRYIQRLTGLEYPAANRLLFEIIEYVEPRMKADQAYPPVVAMAVMRVREALTNAEAEARLGSA